MFLSLGVFVLVVLYQLTRKPYGIGPCLGHTDILSPLNNINRNLLLRNNMFIDRGSKERGVGRGLQGERAKRRRWGGIVAPTPQFCGPLFNNGQCGGLIHSKEDSSGYNQCVIGLINYVIMDIS